MKFTIVCLAVFAGMTTGCAARGPLAVRSASGGDTTLTGPEMRKAHYYGRRPYGTEALYNPLTSIIHNGYDQIRTGPNRQVFRYDYGRSVTATWQSMIHPRRLVREYGFRNWVRYELLPLTLKSSGGGQWVPNYQLHFFGGGVNYIRLIAWYEQHGTPYPRAAAIATSYAGHFLNEMAENGGHIAGTVDAMTDLLIFNPASYLVFSWDWAQRVMAERVELAEWQGQASINFPGETLENVAQTTMVRLPLPFADDWRLFTTMGGSYVGGPSRRFGDSTWLSVGFGWDAARNPVVDTTTGRKTVDLLGNVALYIDRSGSLLGSLVLKSGFDAGLNLNVYPGVIRLGSWSPGFWAHLLRNPGGVRLGITSPLGIGLGTNPRR